MLKVVKAEGIVDIWKSIGKILGKLKEKLKEKNLPKIFS